MQMWLRIGIVMNKTVLTWNSNGFAMLHKKGKVSINCSKTYAWKIIFDKCVYNIGSWVVFA